MDHRLNRSVPGPTSDYAVGMNAGANFVMVDGPGTANDDQGWLCTTLPGSDVIGTHATTWTIFTSANGKIGDLSLAPVRS